MAGPGARLAAKTGYGLSVTILFLLMWAGPLFGQVLSGRWELGAALFPQTTGYEATAFELQPYSQLDLGLDYEGLGLDGTLFFSNLGLEMVWLGWEATFPTGELRPTAIKRTLAQNDYIKVLRAFPSPVLPGEAFEVILIIEALSAFPPGTEITVLEELPRGWAIEPIMPPGVGIAREARQWTVVLGGPGTREEIRYIGYVPREAMAGSYTLSGTARSGLFPDLAFNDTIEVILQATPLPAGVKLSQDLIFTDGADLAFRTMLFNVAVTLDPRLRLMNYFSLYNIPPLASRDTFIIDGEAPGGIKARLALRFSSDSSLAFDSGSLQISGLTLEEVSLRSTTLFDRAGLERVTLELDHSTTTLGLPLALRAGLTYNAELQMELDYLSLRLSSRFDGLLRLYDYYDLLEYDADDDGLEEAHFELKRRQIYLEFSLDKLDIRSISTFEPLLEDLDADPAIEKAADLRLIREEVRIRRALGEVVFTGFATFTAEAAGLLSLSWLRFDLAFASRSLRLKGELTFDLQSQGFAAVVEAAVSF